MEWNFGDILDGVARVVPSDRAALIWRDETVTWARFDERTNNLAQALLDLGAQPNDRAAILGLNHPSYVEMIAASLKARILQVNINYRYVLDEIIYIIEDSQSSIFFYQDAFDDIVSELRPRLPAMRTWVRMETARLPQPAPDGAYSFEDLAGAGDGRPLDIQRSPNDGYLLYTGGTTGRPKGVLWAAGQARRVQLELPLVEKVPQSMEEHQSIVANNPAPSRLIPACPFMHGAGSNAAVGELLNGGTVVILPSDRFDPVELWSEVERRGVTRITIVGDAFAKPMLRALDEKPGEYDLSSMKVIHSAGLTWTAEVKAGLLRHMPQILAVDVLGASEGSGLGVAVAKVGHVPPTGVFNAVPTTFLIDPDTGAILPKDRAVEGLIARNGAMATGYYRDEAKTAATYRFIDGERYVVPGDFARWIPPNQFTLIGRGNLSINTGGEKVFPEEVEEALKLQQGVVDALVVGVADDKWGKVVVAIVQSDDRFDERSVKAGLVRTLASYKHPKRFVFVDKVPRHESGKADYRRAAALAQDAA